MQSPARAGRAARGLALAAASLGLAACLARPPAESAPARLGAVRAATRARAEDVARTLDRLAPRVVEAVPGARLGPLEVWLQETPALYAVRSPAYSDTDGFWAEDVRRIHLRASLDPVDRTLAHELVHASLGPEWDRLPGTLEEGVCDVVAAQLVPHAAVRLSAGRLATALGALGGLPLDVELWIEGEPSGTLVERGLEARLRVIGEDAEDVDPLDVFLVRAGLSTARASPAVRRALYGLGFLVAVRIADRGGLEELHALCIAAQEEDREVVATRSLLAAAELDPDPQSFRAAILERLGARELREILRIHPGILARPVADLIDVGRADDPWSALAAVRGRISIPGNREAVVTVLDVTALRPRLELELAARRPRAAEQPAPEAGTALARGGR